MTDITRLPRGSECDNPALARSIGFEEATAKAVEVAAAALVRIAAPLWRWGDGYGGWVSEVVFDAAASLGLDLPDHTDSFARKPLLLRVAARDGWTCHYCDALLGWGHPSVTVPHLDHVIPKCQGGSNGIDNRVLACGPCNTAKGGRTPEQWRVAYAEGEF